ncbi:metallophosphoesterase [Prosthecochloris sp. N3]|uniref:Metallophosphoesterase n=1 Tax=Prosthecochloris ethylica TaxID=2743976 RepID=A0ABR9XPN8_9CHLB|nr:MULTISPECIES: metallophosphoesterase [Prosthecochloris]MEC9486287.1 metallophosphoesterase [Prosthecochloris sp.]MBF0586146.1 metallophosphoesterase [Prosthecochloris ethylica]MBF0635852.1 metallophosphoesterase [Prosthecochloris ethylica]NUK47473.1 metallophosphoesterase [Prosthecochloris ethylica]RNA65019.1 metallophosphoesterase [Prosthecochloris sp. ZM_2]
MGQYHKKHPHLERLCKTSRVVELGKESRILVISDLHMGNGGRRDEFKRNARLVESMLRRYYLPEGFSLILNGDVEELFKFPLDDIVDQWGHIYDLFREFDRDGFLLRTFGNHDASLQEERGYILARNMIESIRLQYGDESMLVFHGHQASVFLWETYPLVSKMVALFLRYIAKPFGIRNFSMAYNSRRRFAIEKAIYDFSNQSKIVSVIGHTHRPLFESLSKVDYLNYRIEELCRAFPDAGERDRGVIREKITNLKSELDACYRSGKRIGLRSGVYNNITIPSVFNSGCTIGKRGITALEIDRGRIRLVYWFNGKQSRKYLSDRNSTPLRLDSTGYYRIVLNEDYLDYVFSRLHLLA